MGMFDNFGDSVNKTANAFMDTKTDDTNTSLLPNTSESLLKDISTFFFGSATKDGQKKKNIETILKLTGKKPEEFLWTVTGENWYKYFGYLFSVKKENTGSEAHWFHYMLPIPPQSYVCKPIMPSQVTPSLGGVIEEVSAVKFWLISMEGTTGIAGGRDSDDEQREKLQTKFRDTVATTGLLSGAFAQVTGNVNKVASMVDRGIDIIKDPSLQNAAYQLKGAVNDAFTPPIPYASSAVHGKHNGFVEAYALKKFFYVYHMLKSYAAKDFSLYFTNIKTDQSWKIIVKDFHLQQNAQNPFLIRYNINLQAWDVGRAKRIEGINDNTKDFDRFGAYGDLGEVNSVNLNSDKIQNIIAKNIKNPLAGKV